jgi:hypothetical protein
MSREIKFTISDAHRREIAANNTEATDTVYAALLQAAGLGDGEEIEACWIKPQFGNGRSYPVRHAAALQLVVRGVVENHCTELRFFAVSKQSVTPAGIEGPSYKALFC